MSSSDINYTQLKELLTSRGIKPNRTGTQVGDCYSIPRAAKALDLPVNVLKQLVMNEMSTPAGVIWEHIHLGGRKWTKAYTAALKQTGRVRKAVSTANATAPNPRYTLCMGAITLLGLYRAKAQGLFPSTSPR